jgi:N6-adenosine-specific RNA methylase IME4
MADGMSTREMGEVLGVDHATVARDAVANTIPDSSETPDSVANATTEPAQPEPVPEPDRRQTKAEKRAAREAELAAKQSALPDKRYGVIYADPPWRFEPFSRETGMDRAADNHYPTSTTDEIVALPVKNIAADDCVLFLWATVPLLRHALAVMDAWGFDYCSHAIWDKVHIGTGYWFRNQHELLLVGVRGDIPAPAMGKQWPSLRTIPRREHSAKPEQFLELIEEYFPHLPKIELNRRGPPRPNWDAWGLEAEAAE